MTALEDSTSESTAGSRAVLLTVPQPPAITVAAIAAGTLAPNLTNERRASDM
jgi:hypothetical protein